MINPETNDIAVATRVMALADTLGHSQTPEEVHRQARGLLIDLEACANGELKERAVTLSERLAAMALASGEHMTELAYRVHEAAENLRGLLSLERARLAA